MTWYLLFFIQNIFSFSIETVKIMEISSLKNSSIVFTINAGVDRGIKLGDSASFYRKTLRTIKDDRKTQEYFQYLGKARSIQLFPYKSIWSIDYWPVKKHLKKNITVYFYFLANYEQMKAKATIKRMTKVLNNTRPEILDLDSRLASETIKGGLKKSPIKYKDPHGNDLEAIYIKQLQKSKSEREIIESLVQGEKSEFLGHHMEKINNFPTKHKALTAHSIPSDEFSDDALRRLIQKRGERKEYHRVEELSSLWIQTQIFAQYFLFTNSVGAQKGASFILGLEFPLGILHLDGLKWTLSSSYRYLRNQLYIYHNDMGQVEEKTFLLAAHYYLWNNMAYIRKFSWSIGAGIRFGGSVYQNLLYTSSNIYSNVSLPTVITSLKYRIYPLVGLSLDFSLDNMTSTLQESQAEFHMPESLRETQIQIGGGISVYF